MASASQPATALAPGLGRKVKKVLEIKTEAPDLVEALGTLSLLYHENAPARRALRSAVEKRGLEISEAFIGAAETVIQSLNGVSANLEGLSESCNKIFNVLSASKAATSQLAAETERLQNSIETVDVKVKTVQRFLSQYQVSEQEVLALQIEDATDTFFAALAHVRQIHDNCRMLLRTHHQRAGIELMDMMSMYQEMAYERLCRWIQGECRSMGDLDAPDVSPQLQKAVAALRDRPVLFKYCIEEVATARHNALFQRFIAALTRGGPGGMPRPIEMHAHDSKRYVNDMLAWVHQALADEREFVLALFGAEGGGSGSGGGGAAGGQLQQHQQDLQGEAHMDGSGQASGGGGSELLSSAALLDRVFDSICRPLRVRIEQVLMTTPPPLLCFQLAQLHSFYLQLMLRVLGPSAQLVQAIRACRDMATRVFMEQMKARADKMVRSPPQPPKDLSAPPQVMEAVHNMLEVVDAYESAMQSSAPAPSEQQQGSNAAAGGASTDGELQPVMHMLIEAFIEACQRSAESLRQDGAPIAAPAHPASSAASGYASSGNARADEQAQGARGPYARCVYLINCLSAAASALSQRRSAAGWSQQLSAAAEEHVRALVASEVQTLLQRVGCADLLDRLRLYHGAQHAQQEGPQVTEQPRGTPATDPSLSHSRLVEALRAFFTLLSSPDALQEFEPIQLPRVRTTVSSQFADGLAAAYEEIYAALEHPANGYLEQGGAAGVRNGPAQVRTILGIS